MHGHQVEGNPHLAVHDYNINSISPSLYTTGSPWSSDGEANLKDRGRPSTASYDIEHRRVDHNGTGGMQPHSNMHMLNGSDAGMLGMGALGGDPSQQARDFHHAALYGQDLRQLQQQSRQHVGGGAMYDNRSRGNMQDRDDESE
jgi:hypothetical protein